MNITEDTLKQIIFQDWVEFPSKSTIKIPAFPDLLRPLRHWCEQLEINSPELAHRICQLIPAQCPFARTIKLLGRPILTIPPLCKLNPLYEEFVALRFRSLCYLADECGEDISPYCS